MRKALALLVFSLFVNSVLAGSDLLTCRVEAEATLEWKQGGWHAGKFEEREFNLFLNGNKATKDSIANAMGAAPKDVNCDFANSRIVCSATTGNLFMLNPQNNRGGIANIWGTTMTTLLGGDIWSSVSAFTCKEE